MSVVSPYTYPAVGRKQTKEGRYEFRPSPEAAYILDYLSEKNGISRAGIVELALRAFAKANDVPPFTGPNLPGGGSLLQSERTAYSATDLPSPPDE